MRLRPYLLLGMLALSCVIPVACDAQTPATPDTVPCLGAKPARGSTPTATDTAIIAAYNRLCARWNAMARGGVPGKPSAPVGSTSGAQTPPVVPPVAAPAPLAGVRLLPGAAINDSVSKYPGATTFILGAGVHRGQAVAPKSGNTFRGEPGAVLDGGGTTPYAFRYDGRPGLRADDVTLVGFRVTRYAPPAQDGFIHAGLGEDGGGRRWTLDSMTLDSSANLALRVGTRTRLLRSRCTDNRWMCYGGIGDSVLLEGNEIARNGAGLTVEQMNFEGGGGKLVKTRWAVVRNNYSHDNGGVGLWTDIDNRDVLYEGNRVEHNVREGIAHETNGPGATIRNNTLRGNGQRDTRKDAWLWGCGIGVHASPGVEVYGNVLTDNACGIGLVQQARGAGPYGPYEVRDVWVHDNSVDPGTSWPWARALGAVEDLGTPAIFAQRAVRFERNRTTPRANPRPFAWGGAWRTPAEWVQAFPTDTTAP